MPQQTHYTDPVATTVPTLSQAIEFFTQHARLHGRSRKTLALYAWNFEQLRAYVGNTALDRLDTATLRRFLSDLLDRGWKPTSVAIMHRILHAFFVFTVKERFNTANPLDGVPAPKAPKLFPFMLDEAQTAALLDACDRGTRHSVRNYAILLLFLDCGLRLNELISIKQTDVSLVQRSLKVHGKGAKDRIVYMGTRTTKALRRWVEVRRFKPGYADNLFVDRKGEALKPRWVQQVIARIGKRSGLKVRLSPHKLRHVSATLAVAHGMDTFTLQRLYGWENVQTAMRYVNAAAPALREAHAKASPVDRLLEGV